MCGFDLQLFDGFTPTTKSGDNMGHAYCCYRFTAALILSTAAWSSEIRWRTSANELKTSRMDYRQPKSVRPEGSTPSLSCARCLETSLDEFELEFAFQPIVDTATRTIFAHEALVRGPNGESAQSVLAKVNDENRYGFDQTCRVTAIKNAALLGIKEYLSTNFLPNAVYEPAACIRRTLEAARHYGFPIDHLIFEFSETERLNDAAHLLKIGAEYRKHGFKTAIDDFGAGYSGLSLLAEFQPDIVKIDMSLIRDMAESRSRRAIVTAVATMCSELNITVIAEGVETQSELHCLRDAGIDIMQGYYFCRPSFKSIGRIDGAVWQHLKSLGD